MNELFSKQKNLKSEKTWDLSGFHLRDNNGRREMEVRATFFNGCMMTMGMRHAEIGLVSKLDLNGGVVERSEIRQRKFIKNSPRGSR